MKTALLIVGQMRTFATENMEYFKEFVKINNCDVFVNMEGKDVNYNIENMNILRKTFGSRLKICVFDSNSETISINQFHITGQCMQVYRLFLLYSLMYADGIWEDYDVVIRHRPDTIVLDYDFCDSPKELKGIFNINSFIPFDKDTLYLPSLRNYKFNCLYNDQFAFGSPKVMRMYCSMWKLYDIYNTNQSEQLVPIELNGYGVLNNIRTGMEQLVRHIVENILPQKNLKYFDIFDNYIVIIVRDCGDKIVYGKQNYILL